MPFGNGAVMSAVADHTLAAASPRRMSSAGTGMRPSGSKRIGLNARQYEIIRPRYMRRSKRENCDELEFDMCYLLHIAPSMLGLWPFDKPCCDCIMD